MVERCLNRFSRGRNYRWASAELCMEKLTPTLARIRCFTTYIASLVAIFGAAKGDLYLKRLCLWFCDVSVWSVKTRKSACTHTKKTKTDDDVIIESSSIIIRWCSCVQQVLVVAVVSDFNLFLLMHACESCRNTTVSYTQSSWGTKQRTIPCYYYYAISASEVFS